MTHGLAHLPDPADRFTGPFPRFVRVKAMAGAFLFLCALGIVRQSRLADEQMVRVVRAGDRDP